MVNVQNHKRGVTLLEAMLALAIAVSLFSFAVKVYYQFSFQARERKIAYEVNQLFQAMSGYYHANCRKALGGDVSTDDIVLSVQKDLITPGFIPVAAWHPENPLVDNTATDQGYNIQFNRVLSKTGIDPVMSVSACTGSTPSPSCDVISTTVLDSSTQPVGQSRVVLWTIQVAVKLSPSVTDAQREQIKNDLNADCLSTAFGPGVAVCKTTPESGSYLVWTRMPSAYHPEITSDYWISLPYVKQFNMQYTNDGMAALSGVKNDTQGGNDPLNYLCGG